MTRWSREIHERGASLVEYSLLIALIAVVSIGAISALGTVTDAGLGGATSELASTPSATSNAGLPVVEAARMVDGEPSKGGDEDPFPGCAVSPAHVTGYSGNADNGKCSWWNGSCGGTKFWNDNPKVEPLESMYCA